MLKSAIEKILSLANIEEFEFKERNYTSAVIHPVMSPMIDKIKVHTLTGLIDLCGEIDCTSFHIHVVNHEIVRVVSSLHDEWKRLETHIEAIIGDLLRNKFQFGKWYDVEQFIIELQANFVATPHRVEILKLVSSMTSGKEMSSSDDGISQRIAVKTGVHLKADVAVPNPVELAPYRTFIEIEQPISRFVFRVKQMREDELPQCALHEADGGAWRLEAMQSIKKYIGDKLPGISVIA